MSLDLLIPQSDPRLRQRSERVHYQDPSLHSDIASLHRALQEFRQKHGFGRAIAAPQLEQKLLESAFSAEQEEQVTMAASIVAVDQQLRLAHHRSLFVSTLYREDRDWRKGNGSYPC